VDREVPKRLQLHVILDNYATHSHPEVKRWVAKAQTTLKTVVS
jgi:hypothetical protein